jgi:hypothetical protein
MEEEEAKNRAVEKPFPLSFGVLQRLITVYQVLHIGETVVQVEKNENQN